MSYYIGFVVLFVGDYYSFRMLPATHILCGFLVRLMLISGRVLTIARVFVPSLTALSLDTTYVSRTRMIQHQIDFVFDFKRW